MPKTTQDRLPPGTCRHPAVKALVRELARDGSAELVELDKVAERPTPCNEVGLGPWRAVSRVTACLDSAGQFLPVGNGLGCRKEISLSLAVCIDLEAHAESTRD